MEAKDLRIGNYYDNHGQVMQVTPNTIEEVWLAERSWCEPIPLTEEWLLKFGFEKIGGTIYKNIGSIEIGFIGKRFYIQVGIENRNIKNIQHVHQLQNLYFALTGEELTLKK